MIFTGIVKNIFDIVGYEVPIDDKGERKGDVPSLVASAKKIKAELGWSAKVSLDEGLQETIDFFKSHSSVAASALFPGD